MIVSDHNPLDAEHKNVEFDVADFGVIGTQTLFSVINTFSDLDLEMIIEKITTNPRRLFGLESPGIEVGKAANLTVFQSMNTSNFSESGIKSISKNSPFKGKVLNGSVLAVFNNGKYKVLGK
jgi:dihydroorotase